MRKNLKEGQDKNTRIDYVCFEGGGDESHVEVNTFTEFFPLVARELEDKDKDDVTPYRLLQCKMLT
jgi:hypothetical protein